MDKPCVYKIFVRVFFFISECKYVLRSKVTMLETSKSIYICTEMKRRQRREHTPYEIKLDTAKSFNCVS